MSFFNKPTSEQVESALPRLSSPQHARYFFERLENPNWIEPLKRKGFFAESPRAVSTEGGGACYPPWPESKYLARMARHAPEAVADILCGINTDNPSVIRDILVAGSVMPASIAKLLVPTICNAHTTGALWTGFVEAADLCGRLADEGEGDASLQLARQLFHMELPRVLNERRERHNNWYIEGLQRANTRLVASRGVEFVSLMLEWLGTVARAKAPAGSSGVYDGSPFWRPAVEEHGENPKYDFASTYVTCVREALETAVGDNRIGIDELLTLLDGHDWLIHRRLRLHIVNVCAESIPAVARLAMMDHRMIDDDHFKHEYAMLCGTRFALLTAAERASWVGWANAGPDLSEFDEHMRFRCGRDATQEERTKRVEYWRYEKLHWIREHLDGDEKRFYRLMLAENGEPDLADLNIRSGGVMWGYESPFRLEELSGRDFGQVVEALATWRPTKEDGFGPCLAGAAGTFRDLLRNNTEAYACKARLLVGRPHILVQTYLEAMRDGNVGEAMKDPSALLELCRWVVDQVPTTERANGEDSDLGSGEWQAVRDCVSDVMWVVCDHGAPMTYRWMVWQLIEPLTRDTGRSYVIESPEDLRAKDYTLMSLNSPAGKAMRAAFAYARWVGQSAVTVGNGKESAVRGFDSVPEFRELLESRLAADDAGGASVRAMIGWHWSTMYTMDREWVERNVSRIFDLQSMGGGGDMPLGWAAWNTFLMANNPSMESYQVLRKQFGFAVDQASDIHAGGRHGRGPCERLAEHVILLYARGSLALDDDDGIVKRLLTKTAVHIRTHAIRFIGINLWREQRAVFPKAVKQRLMLLWDWYWDNVGEADGRNDPHSDAFSYWFLSDVFDEKWGLERLERFVGAVRKPEADLEIVGKLAEIAAVDLPRAIRIVGCLVEGDDEGWRIGCWAKQSKAILALGVARGAETGENARRIINILGRRGFEEFGELLDFGR